MQPAAYQARAGSCTWLNGVYLVNISKKRPDGLLVIENRHDVGKIKVERVQSAIEPDLIYPLLRGRDVSAWRAIPSTHIIMVQDPEKRTGLDEQWMKVFLPRTYAFLKKFEKPLRRRSGYKKYLEDKGAPFYSIYNVGPYTLAPFKVVWTRVARDISAAVVGPEDDELLGTKCVIPIETATMVPFENEEEANFFCAMMNSSLTRFIIVAYSSHGTGSFGSPHVLKHVAIPQFDIGNTVHTRLAALSQQAHQLAAARDEAGLAAVEAQVDEAAAELWGITDKELKEIRRSLEELG